MKTNSKPSIRDYILANPGASTREVMKATGAQRDSVNTLFTMLRRKYRNAPVNAAGVMQPEGLPAFTPEMFEQLTTKRPSVRFKHRKKRVVMVKKEKKPVDLTAQPVKLPEEPARKRIEAIDLIESHGLGFHLGMVIEYICMASRLGTNDGMRSLELAKVYLDRAITNNVEPNVSR